MKLLLLAIPLPLLAACMNDRPGGPRPPLRECRAGPAERFVGMNFRPAMSRQAQRASGARTVRVIRPGQAVTMDFRQDRLNIELGEGGRVRGVRCG